MRAIRLSFLHMLKLIRQDRMLLVAGLAPLLAGIAIRYAVPLAESSLVRLTGAQAVLAPYYGLFDLFFVSLTPAMFCFIAAMVMLEERDDHIDRYLSATALGRNGYYISRIVLPALAAFAVTAILLPVFHLTPLVRRGDPVPVTGRDVAGHDHRPADRNGILQQAGGHGCHKAVLPDDTGCPHTGFCPGAVFFWIFFSAVLLDGKSNGGEKLPLSAAVCCGGGGMDRGSVDEGLQGLPVKAKRSRKSCGCCCGFCRESGIYKIGTFL